MNYGRSILRRIGTNAAAVALAEAKQYFRVDHNDDDLQIAALLKGAQSYVEDYCRLTITYQRWEILFDGLPDTLFLELPRRQLYLHNGGPADMIKPLLVNSPGQPDQFLDIGVPVKSVVGPGYLRVDKAIDTATLASPIVFVSEYDGQGNVVENVWTPTTGHFQSWDGNPPRIYFNSSVSPAGHYGLKVEFTTGYGIDATSTPESLKQIILMLAGNWYLNRESNSGTAGPLPFGVDMLLRQWDSGEYK